MKHPAYQLLAKTGENENEEKKEESSKKEEKSTE